MEETYSIVIRRNKKKESLVFTSENGDERISGLIFNVFKWRTKRPSSLRFSDGVKLSLCRTSGGPKLLLKFRVYNRSVKQTVSELIKAFKPYLV